MLSSRLFGPYHIQSHNQQLFTVKLSIVLKKKKEEEEKNKIGPGSVGGEKQLGGETAKLLRLGSFSTAAAG